MYSGMLHTASYFAAQTAGYSPHDCRHHNNDANCCHDEHVAQLCLCRHWLLFEEVSASCSGNIRCCCCSKRGWCGSCRGAAVHAAIIESFTFGMSHRDNPLDAITRLLSLTYVRRSGPTC
jgi:hypothetical protein